jgi:hypothetical protein
MSNILCNLAKQSMHLVTIICNPKLCTKKKLLKKLNFSLIMYFKTLYIDIKI